MAAVLARAAAALAFGVLFFLPAFDAIPARAQTTPSPDLRDDQFAVAYQINPAHTGSITFDQSFAPPLKVLWHQTAEGPMTYPLIARGKVFVWVSHNTGNQPQSSGRLYALDKTSGMVLWQADLASPTGGAVITYDNGHIFIVTADGYVRSLNADSGTQEWSVFVQGPFQIGAPTAANGRLFLTYGYVYSGLPSPPPGPAYVLALDETNGSTLWTQPITTMGVDGFPSVSGEGVFVGLWSEAYGFNPATGALLWHVGSGSTYPPIWTLVYYRGSVYDVDGLQAAQGPPPVGSIIDANTGNVTGTYGSGTAGSVLDGPAVQGSAGYVSQTNTGTWPPTGSFLAFDLRTGNTLWSHDAPGGPAAPPLVVNGTVYTLDYMGTLHAYDRVSGNELWNANGGAVPEGSIDGTVAGMAAGEGVLVVPIGQDLYALVPASGN